MGYRDISPQELKQAVERALVKPEWCRSYHVSPAEARTVYGVDGELAAVLAGLGFPRRGSGENTVFDPLDLENLALDLGLPSASRTAMSFWARAFKDPARLATARCRVQISWNDPADGQAGNREFSMSPRLERRSTGPIVHEGSGWSTSVDVRLLNEEHVFEGEFSALVEEAASLHFHRLIPGLAEDMAFLRASGIADCRSASLHLAAMATELGLTVRLASGYFVGAPFLVPHIWLEVDVNGRWIAADPFFLQALARWGVVSPDAWPPAKSPRNVLWRVREDHHDEPLIRTGAVDVPVKLVARFSYGEHDVDPATEGE